MYGYAISDLVGWKIRKTSQRERLRQDKAEQIKTTQDSTRQNERQRKTGKWTILVEYLGQKTQDNENRRDGTRQKPRQRQDRI